MITKAIVEEVISPYQVRVRVPILDRSKKSSLSTKTENLNTYITSKSTESVIKKKKKKYFTSK